MFRHIKTLAILTAFLFTLLRGAALKADELTVTFDAPEYRLIETNGQHTIEMDGFNCMLTPGKPRLPAKSYLVALPPGARVNSISIAAHETADIDGTYRIKPAAASLPNSDDPRKIEQLHQQWQGNYDVTYGSDRAYPTENAIFAGTGGLRKYTYANIFFCPFTYQPVSGRLRFTPSVTVTIEYSPGPVDDPRTQRRLHDTKADARARELFVNFEQARGWYQPLAQSSAPEEEYDCLVLFADGLEGPADAWCSGFMVERDLIATAGHCVDAYPGADRAEKTRAYVYEKYWEWNIDHLLILGDVDSIPMRQTFPEPDVHDPISGYCPFTDYYYADLTGDWDSDGDGFYGEYGQDNVDFTPELHVARIPFNDPVTVMTILENIYAFDHDQGDWKNNTLLMGAMMNYENEDYTGLARTDGADLWESITSTMLLDFNNTTMYEAEGLDPSWNFMDYDLNHENVVYYWSEGNTGFIGWWGYSWEDASSRKIWEFDDGDGMPEAHEIFWSDFLLADDAPLLEDDKKPILFGVSSLSGSLEPPGAGKAYLQHGAGAALVAPTAIEVYHSGWSGPADGGAASYTWHFFDYVLDQDRRLGSALTATRMTYANNFLFWEGWPGALNLYNFCLFGNTFTLYDGEPASCCAIRGDIDHNGQYDAMDVVYFVDWLWNSGPEPPCMDEADTDGSGEVNPMDLIYIIDHMWNSGPGPVACP